MTRSLIILILIAALSLMVFKASDKNADAEDTNGLGQVLENQQIIIEKLNSIEEKVNGLRTRIY